jgi:hypothetical protein
LGITSPAYPRSGDSMDAIVIAIAVVFFVLSAALVAALARL